MNINGLSRQALNSYFSDKASGQMQGEKKRLVIQHDKNTSYLDYRSLTTLEKVKAFFGFGDASFRNIARFCAEKHITHEKLPESIDAYNSKKSLFKRVGQVFKNRIQNQIQNQKLLDEIIININRYQSPYEGMKSLLKCGVDIHAPGKNGISALEHAYLQKDELLMNLFTESERTESGKQAIKQRIDDLTFLDKVNDCILEEAEGYEELLEMIKKGADINALDQEGYTALMNACTNGDDELVQFLLDQGADIEVKDNDGNTALMLLVQEDDLDENTLQVLLKAGATIDEKTKALAEKNNISLDRND